LIKRKRGTYVEDLTITIPAKLAVDRLVQAIITLVLKFISVLYCRLFLKETVVVVSYGSLIYNYLCTQCLSPLTLGVRIFLMTRLYSIQHYVIKFVS